MTMDNPARFALAGNAVFTLSSVKTGARFTYRVRAAEQNPIHFVSVLTGPNNSTDWKYLGYFRRGVYFHGAAKAKISAAAPSAVAFKWWWENTARGIAMPSLELDHSNRCGRCGRPLTVPESIRTGLGPECAGKL
jgi:hypothetical protein